MILQALINSSEDFVEFKHHHNSKSESAQHLVKEKGVAQRKLTKINSDITNLKKEVAVNANEVEQLEKKQSSNLDLLEKDQLHKMVNDLKKAKNQKVSLQKSLEIMLGKQ